LSRRRNRRLLSWGLPAALILVLIVTGCSSLGFYTQSVGGELAILWKRKPVTEILADDHADAKLRDKLERVLDARNFASADLLLPDNGSFRTFVRLDRPYAVWNVVAAPALSVDPVTWCFPIAGCVSYRGYFSKEHAEKFAEKLRARGLDVTVEGVSAYSTLGWFRDPVLSSFIDWPAPDLASLIFHELAHQRLYVKNDTVFNESFASVIEREGLTRYLRQEGDEAALASWQVDHDRQDQFAALVLGYRERLRDLYASSIDTQEKLRRKQQVFADLVSAYQDLKASWGGYAGYDRWFGRDLNNANLASVGAYDKWVPAFETMLQDAGGDLAKFYDDAKGLAKMKPEDRQRRLTELSPPAASDVRASDT
jgi:predicted aminopeptidase